jgi:hypothetical protein
MPKKIRIFLECSAVRYHAEEFVDAPEGWDEMTDDEKDDAMATTVEDLIANQISAGWNEVDE